MEPGKDNGQVDGAGAQNLPLPVPIGAPQQVPQPGVPQAQAPSPQVPISTGPTIPAPVQAPTSTTPTQGVPEIADDTDLIEKEWVEKAKQLVDMTKADPHTQNKELNKFKASYIKKRYNRDIHLSKD